MENPERTLPNIMRATSHANLSNAAEVALVKKASESSAGQEELREYLLPVIREIASNYVPNQKNLSREKLIGLGETAIPIATKRFFESEKGAAGQYKFSSYFSWWANQAMRHELGLRGDDMSGEGR